MQNDLEYFEKIIQLRAPYNLSSSSSHQNGDLIQSAVMVPFVSVFGSVHLLFTVRSKTLQRHSGQVAFPGGFIEKSDLTASAAAIRETCEEIGICETDIKIIGQLHPFNSGTGYFIYPFIGIIADYSKMQINQDEVDKVIFIPLKWLRDEKNAHIELYKSKDGSPRKIWFFSQFEGELLWGISAKITKDVIGLLNK